MTSATTPRHMAGAGSGHHASAETGSGATAPGRTAPPVRIALIHLVATPYFLHLHRRIAAELPEIELHSLYTHEVADQPWTLDQSADVRPIRFGDGRRKTVGGLASVAADLRKGRAIIRWLKEHRVAAVILYGYVDLGRVRIALWCRRAGVPCLLTGDNNIHLDNRRSFFKRVVKRVLISALVRRCAGVMPFGTAGEKYFLRYGARQNRMFRYPAEPDYDLIRAVGAGAVAGAAKRFELAPGRRRIIWCGRLVWYKRVDLLIKAFAQIAPARPEWDLVILGDGDMRDSLREMVPSEFAGRVLWTGFVGDAPTIAAVYRNCDVLAVPSDIEPWALVVNEALAAGLAVVTSDVVGAADDLVRPGVNGWTFPRGDAAGLAGRLLDVTAPDKIDEYRRASADVLEDWRRGSDPIKGLRAALVCAAVLPA